MNTQTELATTRELAVTQSPPISSLSILDAAVRGGINKENVEVVERLIALRREELKEQSKAAFAKAFFQLKANMPEIYADKEARDNGGAVVYRYCSEEEISKRLEPVLMRHGFVTLFGQRQEDERTVAIVTLIHEQGHQETREYSVRVGATNRMKDATAADAGSTTSAWRHLMIKMFGLKSRLTESLDARNLGEPITKQQAEELEHRLKMLNGNEPAFLKLAGARSYDEILSVKFDILDEFLRMKERKGR